MRNWRTGLSSIALTALAARYRGQAQAAKTLAEERLVVHQLLSHIPASHLGRLSRSSYRALMADLLGVSYPNFRFPGCRRGRFALREHGAGGPGEFVNISIGAEEYSAFGAAEASIRAIHTNGERVGYSTDA